ncbi:ATP-binding cassette domain-containing protein [Natronosporangium hydrolyticum]|uniref:ATP-binding cassette domain-containing protein n=1 Tax=Natronosporangium hydrolyticum TaxID=2811111 RepID=A0A895YTL2_9ACTN|nr:ATP-binding cassette domain-containing protein [Natronosporangium hydrolyticum]
MVRLSVEELRHRYRPQSPPVLDGVSLEVTTGETVAIMGPSGSGKTTLLALLGGLLPVQEGLVAVVTNDQATRPTDYVAWVLQTVNVLADRTVADNVALGGLSAGQRYADAVETARWWLAEVGLLERGDDPVGVLSGGEIQRVVIARALASARPLVLADEPTGQLDAATTATVLSVLLDGSHGRSVVVVTHDPEVARRCDRALRLRDGVLHPESPAPPAVA